MPVEKLKAKRELEQLDSLQIVKVLWNKIIVVLFFAALGLAVALIFTIYCVTPLYKSSIMFYVNNSKISIGETQLSISQSDLTAAQSLVDTYIAILNTPETKEEIQEEAGLHKNAKVLKNISADSVNSTEIFQVTVIGENPREIIRVADTIGTVLPERISSIVEGSDVRIVNHAYLYGEREYPSYSKSALIGFLLGFFASALLIVLKELLDNTVCSEEYLNQVYRVPILTVVPNLNSNLKLSKYSKAFFSHKHIKGKKREEKKRVEKMTIGGNITFEAQESYNLLRTNLLLSFSQEKKCKTIGITSAMRGDGKSITAINIAHSLAMAKYRVLLIEGDLRLPTISANLGTRKIPGLANYLTNQCKREEIIKESKLDENLFVATAGSIPPNPSELLNSEKMKQFLSEMSKEYEFLIVDMPPVSAVSDAIVLSQLLDGIAVLVRHRYTDRTWLLKMMKQFEYAQVRVLGFVFNDFMSDGSKYYKKYKKHYGKYKKYYKKEKE